MKVIFVKSSTYAKQLDLNNNFAILNLALTIIYILMLAALCKRTV